MNTVNTNATPVGRMFVKALYDYSADDKTSLSFRQGDVIQVLTQLESGWWDGMVHGERGWFPSNYCTLVDQSRASSSLNGTDEDSEEDFLDGNHSLSPRQMNRSQKEEEQIAQEEGAFWIPQATPDGRLFYFNTLTGVSTMELPLDTSVASSDIGSHSAGFVSRLPPLEEMPTPAGQEREHESMSASASASASASENEGSSYMAMGNHESPSRRRRSRMSGEISSAIYNDSLTHSDVTRSRMTADTSYLRRSSRLSVAGGSNMMQDLFESGEASPLTWTNLVGNMQQTVDEYRLAINADKKSEFVKKVEQISDCLRLLLAAGSGTTDKHSGNPSIISTNKALYPHFREMMSSFSKLVLSSHFAATDYCPPEAYGKCLADADGVLHGMSGYVEVARKQRGELLPRLTPGFILSSINGGSWTDIPTSSRTALAHGLTLNSNCLQKIDGLKNSLLQHLQQVEELLTFRERLITPSTHAALSDNICRQVGRILDASRPYISLYEQINLSSFRLDLKNPKLDEFAMHKQRFYDAAADLILAAQTLSAPLPDEWSEASSPPLDERLEYVRSCSDALGQCTMQLQLSVQVLSDLIPVDSAHANNRISTDYSDEEMIEDMQRLRLFSENGAIRSQSEATTASTGSMRGPNSKVQRFFGEAPTAQIIAIPKATESSEDEEARILKLDHAHELQYDTKVSPPQIRGGSLVALVEQLTRHDKLDSPFNNTFLLTYQSFTNAAELFEMLVARWTLPPPPALHPVDLQRWIDKKQKPIRFRVVNILKNWFDGYWMEPNNEKTQKLMHEVHTFAQETVASTNTPGAGPLITAIEQRMRGQDSGKRGVLTLNGLTPPPILPRNVKKLKFSDIDALEFARQLTIIENKLLAKIKVTECLDKTWQKKLNPGEPDPAINIKTLISHSNQLTNWVVSMILTQADVKRRQIVIKHFLTIADKCRALNNFSTLMSIISALATAPINRLTRTWAQVNQRTQAVLESMRKLMSPTKNFLEYRETLHKANPPCLPFFGVYLTDLTFIEDGIPSLIKKTDLINFAKRAKTAEVIRDIQQYQNVPYALQPVQELQDYILKNMSSAQPVSEMYERSLLVEPREREDEKIARLLSESGFL